MGSTVTIKNQDGICILTLNREERRNAITNDMLRDFKQAVTHVKEDAKAKALVLTGSGKGFCSGADLELLEGYKSMPFHEVEKDLLHFYSSLLCIIDLQIPTLAAINGAAIGAGASLAMACDMRLAVEDAKIGFTFIHVGINPGMGTEYLLNRLIGPARTMELLMTGDILTADNAMRIGLVNRVVPRPQLMEETMALAARIAAMPPLPIRVIKENTRMAATCALQDLLVKQCICQAVCFQGGKTE